MRLTDEETGVNKFNDETLYKCLDEGESCHGGSGKWTPGRWRSVRGKVVACVRGIHYCRGAQVLRWLSPDLWLFEDGGTQHVERPDKCVTNRGRVTERIETWTDEAARLFAVDCARLAVNRYAAESQREVLHACLDAAVGHALGYCDADALSAAESAALDAEWFAMWASEWSASLVVARVDSLVTTSAAACSASAICDATCAAAGMAAATTRAAAEAAREAARAEQYALLCRYLSGEQGPFVEVDE